MYFSVSSVMKYHDYMAIHCHHIQFLSYAYDHCHIQKVFLSKNKDILGNKKPKTNFLQ